MQFLYRATTSFLAQDFATMVTFVVFENLVLVLVALSGHCVLPTAAVRPVAVPELSTERISVYIGIFSAAENKARRQAVRNSWLAKAKLQFDADFIVGRAGQNQLLLEGQLADEEQLYGDIVRVPTLDVYSERPSKALALFSQGVKRGYSFIVKVDDDQFFWPFEAWSFFKDRDPQKPIF